MHDTLLNGESFNICFSEAPVNMILNHLSFVSGKHYSIVDGDGTKKVSGPLKGDLSELIAQLGKIGNVTIVEN